MRFLLYVRNFFLHPLTVQSVQLASDSSARIVFFVEEKQTASRYCAEFFLHPLTVRPVGFEGSPVGFEGDGFIRGG